MSRQAEYNQRKAESGQLTWEMITDLVRLWQHEHGLLVDGMAGPVTLATLAPPQDEPPAGEWEAFDGPLESQPKNRTEIYRMFGNPGTGTADKAWERENIVELHGANKLPNVPDRLYVKLHKLVEPYAREAMRRAQASSSYRVERFGGYVFRHQRHDKSRPLSNHAWGIAFDINPAQNRAVHFSAGKAPEPWSPEWTKIWPEGMDEPFVKAIESCGFTWGGRWSSFVDPMHFEFTGRHAV